MNDLCHVAEREAGLGEILVQRLLQRHPFAERNRYAFVAEFVEKIFKHGREVYWL